MYLAVEFQGNWAGEWEKIPDDEYKQLCQILPGLPPEKPKYDPSGTFLLTYENVDAVTKYNLKFVLSKDEKAQAIGTMLVKLQDRIHAVEQKQITKQNFQDGSIVQITIPDIGLMYIDEVDVLTDACTDDLQRQLDKGWRILAVCPPNAQRRPDYVLGRRQPKGE